MRKVLNIKYPTITTYTQHAHLLAILENESRAKPWIYSNYIQIYANKDLNINNWADFYFPMPYEIRPFELCKWIEVQKNSEEYVDSNHESIIEYVSKMIDRNYYVHMMINYKYLAGSRFSKRNRDRKHDVLIYGYDNEKELLYCADFMFDKSKYSFGECTFSELISAYNNDIVKKDSSYLNHYIYSYKVKADCDYEYHLNNIVFWIRQYISGESPEYWNGFNYCNKKNILWGINYYDALWQSLLTLSDEGIDVRFYYLLKDHKKIMKDRLLFLEYFIPQMGEYIREYEKIYYNIALIVNMVIKYNITNEKVLVKKIIDKLKETKNIEYKILEEAISYLVSANTEDKA